MNKIVREHYPVEKLPEDLRAELAGQNTVTVTIEEEEPGARSAPAGSRIPDLLTEARRLREAGAIKSVTAEEAAAHIRALRDEWDN